MATKLRRRPRLEVLEGRCLLAAALGSIRGVVYEDRDGDGARELGEDGLAGRVVFLDANHDGRLEPGEAHTTTGLYGAFAFTGLAPGRYTVGRVVPEGWVSTGQSSPATGATPADAAAKLIGLDRLRGDPRFAGLDGSGQSVVVIDTRIDARHPFFGPDANGDGRGDAVAVQRDFTGSATTSRQEGGHGTFIASVIGSRDLHHPGVATGAELIALTALGDDGTGDFANIEKALRWVLDNADRYHVAAVNLSFGDGGNYSTTQALHGIDDELEALAARGVLVVAATGNDQALVDEAPGIAYPAAGPGVQAVSAVWASNSGPASWANGARDYSTAPDRIVSFAQRVDGMGVLFAPGALIVGAAAGGGTAVESGTSVATAFVSGAVALAQQLAHQQLGRALSPAELRGLMQRTGAVIRDGDDENDNVVHTGAEYRRLDVYALAVAIREMGGPQPDDVPPISPLLTVGPGQALGGVTFADFKPGRLAGVVFADRDGDGRRGAAEPGIAGRVVYLDANGNDRLDADERKTTTGEDGSYVFTGLTAGTVEVRQVLPADQRQTTPALWVKVSSGTDRAGLNLGAAPAKTAPELTGPGTMTAVAANDPAPHGDAVRDLLGATFHDIDPGTRPGIAVLGGTGQGRWQFSLDGGRSWTDVGAATPAHSRLLADAARVRFLPARGWSGQAVLTYRGWDGSVGRQGGWVNLGPELSGRGAFSLQVRSATVRVVRAAPSSEVAAPVLTTVARLLKRTGPPAGSFRGVAVESATGPGQWFYSSDGWTWRALAAPPAGRAILLPVGYRLRFVPRAGAVGFPLVTYRIWQQGGWSEQLASVTAPGIGRQRYAVELG